MKTVIASIVLTFTLLCIARAEEFPTAKLDAQAKGMATAIQARETHPLHVIDHDVQEETAAWQKQASSLTTEQKKKFDALCADLAKQATRVHHDGHHKEWDDATAAQKQFVADVAEIKPLLSPSGSTHP